MANYPDYKCWELMDCDNLDCPARHEPKIPCWEVARRVEAYHNVSNTCSDCIVYLFRDETAALSIKKLQNIIIQRENLKNSGAGHQGCI